MFDVIIPADQWPSYLPIQRADKYVLFTAGLGPRNPLQIARKWGPRAPQISSDCPRKSLDFEIGVGDRLGTLKVSRSKRLLSIQSASRRATTKTSKPVVAQMPFRGGRVKGLTGRPGPREPPKSAGNGGPGPPRYRRTVLGNGWVSKSGWGTGWAPLGCPGQNAYFQFKMPPKGPPRWLSYSMLRTSVSGPEV